MGLHERIEAIHQLDDDALLRSLKRFVGSANQLTALVLAHLAEVDARAAYRRWACDTLTTYCVYELRLSEDEAQRRCRAARIARQFPMLFEMLADASIHLTGILLLGPYLTEENHREVLVRARYRRKSEIQRLVAELAPACDVPAVIEPLGPAREARIVLRSGWGAAHEALMGGVRQLIAGEGPSEAPSATEAWCEGLLQALDDDISAPARSDADEAVANRTLPPSASGESSALARSELMAQNDTGTPSDRSGALRYRVQFTADQEYVDLFEQARALAWHQLPSGDIAALQKLAMQALVEKLLRRKCAVKSGAIANVATEPPTAAPRAASDPDPLFQSLPCEPSAPARSEPKATESSEAWAPELELHSEQRPADPSAPARSARAEASIGTATSVSRSSTAPHRRHVPAAVRRAVWQRDAGRCTFIDERGRRCPATAAIEFHHEQPYARGGPDTLDNVHLRCRAHNDMAAKHAFGAAFMQRKKENRAGPRGA